MLDSSNGGQGGWFRVVRGLLAVSYGIGGPLVAMIEHRSQTFSQRFDLSPEVFYLTSAIQLICAFGVLAPRSAPFSAALLSVITVGAVFAHLRIGSPLTAVPALLYTAVQIWFGLRSRAPEVRS